MLTLTPREETNTIATKEMEIISLKSAINRKTGGLKSAIRNPQSAIRNPRCLGSHGS
jgi:hypothetical protein